MGSVTNSRGTLKILRENE
ncbi:hypothetical protein AVEN_222819-1, partial [Araneus ventricosus]